MKWKNALKTVPRPTCLKKKEKAERKARKGKKIRAGRRNDKGEEQIKSYIK